MTDLEMHSPVRIHEDAAFEVLNGEAIVLNLKTGIYYTLNETGTRIWQLIEESGDLDRVQEAMVEEFEVEPDDLKVDLKELLTELRERGLVETDF